MTKTFQDAILVGVIDAFHECKITPQTGERGRVSFTVEGEDIDGIIKRIYDNKAVGALDVLLAVKAARQAIFSFKDNDKGDTTNGHNKT